MKTKLTFLFLALSILCFVLCSCANFWVDTSDVKITYELNNGEEPLVLGLGITGVLHPHTPVREGYHFKGWYKDKACTKPYDFDQTPTQSMTLYAGWLFDAREVINRFGQTCLDSNVCVKATFYNGALLGEVGNSKVVSGSGVIVYEDSEKYYVLSNNHVVHNTTDFPREMFEVIDAYGRVHRATLLYRDAAYDLSLLSFSKGTKKLSVAELCDADTPIGNPVVAVGSPDGQINTVSVGYVTDFDMIVLDNVDEGDNDINFPVIFHDAPIDNGSSGGALFDEKLRLIGINFAATQRDNTFKLGLAVSADKVREFLGKTELKPYF